MPSSFGDMSIIRHDCRSKWEYASIYSCPSQNRSFRALYLLLDEGTLTFNSDAEQVCSYK